MNYETTIGLEIHAELKTLTKMFCDSPNDPDETHPNVNICPICMGHPGALPVINRVAVGKVIQVGLALHGEVASRTQFERKNYFYPDLPKGYQISQYQQPLVRGGYLDIPTTPLLPAEQTRNPKSEIRNKSQIQNPNDQNVRRIRIQRVHLEEDTGRLIHDPKTKTTLVDFNRAGIPLMELVTEPDLRSAAEARAFAEELQMILRYLEVSDADMEKGQMRIEANVSIRPLSNGNRMSSNESRIMLRDESYRLMKLLFEVHNKLGSIYKEKNYQDAVEAILEREGISYEREKGLTLKFENLEVSDFFADFLIAGKIVLEIKAKPFLTNDDIRQASRYIKSVGVPLAILANFKRQKLEYKRVVNPTFENDSSLFEDDSRKLGTKVELKNINSFRFVEQAIIEEVKRQATLLDRGERVRQETRGWDAAKGTTVSQRLKEESQDYRYFPEPDLPPLQIEPAWVRELASALPELPAAKLRRFQEEFKIDATLARTLVRDKALAAFFEAAASELGERRSPRRREDLSERGSSRGGNAHDPRLLQLAANYLTTDVVKLLAKADAPIADSLLTPENFAELITYIAEGRISSRTAKEVLEEMFASGADPSVVIEERRLWQVSASADLAQTVERVIAANAKAAADYKSGKAAALQFLLGQVMQEASGANPTIVQKLLEEQLR